MFQSIQTIVSLLAYGAVSIIQPRLALIHAPGGVQKSLDQPHARGCPQPDKTEAPWRAGPHQRHADNVQVFLPMCPDTGNDGHPQPLMHQLDDGFCGSQLKALMWIDAVLLEVDIDLAPRPAFPVITDERFPLK